jgi:hypothetical protein
MEENQTLRNLLRSVSAFIGDGAGGLLPRMGWTLTDFNNYINKSETDTAWESYQRRKKNAPSASAPLNQPAQKRAAEDTNPNSSRPKRPRGHGEQDGEGEDRLSLLVPMNNSAPHLAVYPTNTNTRPAQDGHLFADLMKGSTGSPMFARSPTSTTSPTQYGGAPSSNVNTYQTSYMAPLNMNVDSSLSSLPFSSSSTPPSMQQRLTQLNQRQDVASDDDDDPNRNEAYKLIAYVTYQRKVG